jgi:hypothetical protein
MADKKISQLTAKGTPIAATDLVEISESNGAGGYVTKSVTGANILASKQDTLVSGTNIKTINGSSVLGSGNLVVTPGVASLTATAPVVATGTSTPDISLASGYGDTQNPYASKTANHILAAPNGTAGVPTFRAMVATDVPTLNQSTTGNAATVTTNANLTGPVTSIGNATAIANGAISNAMLANGAVANLSGTNTGDNATNSQYSGLVSNATHTGDAEGNFALTVKGINNTILSNLNTGILKNTTGTGVPSIAVAADFPILNQNTTGTAGSTATLATARTISTNGDVLYTSPPFDGSANVLGTATLASIGVAGTYTKVTTDAKGRVTVGANITAGDVPTLNQNTTGTAANVTGIVAVANGGTGTATPSLVAGTNVTITGTFPNQTINSSGGGGGGGTEIGALIGGGIVVAVFVQGGVNKALVASLTNLGVFIPWTVPAQQTTASGANSFFDGLTNTNAIIAQTGLPATTAYAVGRARLFADGGFSDWYLPSLWELNMCFNSAAIVNKILGSSNGFGPSFNNYWSSTEFNASNAYAINFNNGTMPGLNKNETFNAIRAVRIHTI